jgi:hypothetical protein
MRNLILLAFVVLLITLLAAFVGLGRFDLLISENVPSLFAGLNEAGVSMFEIQTWLGVGVLFCLFVIVIFSMLDPIGDTIKSLIKPLIKLIPLFAFLTALWKTYSPVIFSVLPAGVAEAFGTAKTDNYVAQSVSDGTFLTGVLATLGTMLLFVIATYALRRTGPDNEQIIKELRAQNERLRRQLRGL